MDDRDQLEMWAQKWEQAQKKWAAEAPAQTPQKRNDNFFGLQTNSVPDGQIASNDADDWRSIYDRSAEIRDEHPQDHDDHLFQEQAAQWRKMCGISDGKKTPQKQAQQEPRPQAPQAKPQSKFHEQAEGWRKLLGGPGKDVTFNQHPQHHMSMGMDQGKSPYEPTRVAPNFSDGNDLRQLNDLKVKLERLESNLLANEIKAGKANVPANDWKSQLDSLRQQIDSLSDKLTPIPGEDVY